MKIKRQIVEKIVKLKEQQKQLKNIGDSKEAEKLEISIKTLQWVINDDLNDGGKDDF